MVNREDIFRLPWVRVLKHKGGACEGIKWQKVALRDIYSIGGKPPRGIKVEARCKMRARYSYSALNGVRTKRYCFHHLVSAVLNEYDRNDRWLRKHTEKVQ